MNALLAGLWSGLALILATSCPAQVLALDPCDGSPSVGFVGEGFGAWRGAVTQSGSYATASHGNHFRQLVQPIQGGVVYYAITLRLQAEVHGYASVVPARDARSQFSELGANSGFRTQECLWTTARGVVRTGLACTTLQTLVQRYDLDRRTWSAWAAAGDGRSMLQADGRLSKPAVDDAPLDADRIEFLYLTKGSPEVLELHRLALARTVHEVLGSPAAAAAVPVTGAEPAPTPAVVAAARPSAGIRRFAQHARVPAAARILFFGDSLTWEGGHIDRLATALQAARPDLRAELRKCGLNGGKSTDLRFGAKDLYGTSQPPFATVLAEERPTLAILHVGINDVWHGEKGNSPAVFEAAITAMLLAASAAKVPVVLCTPGMIGEKRRGENPFDGPLDACCLVVRKLAERHGATLCDLRLRCGTELLLRNPTNADSGVLTRDGVHCNDAGNEVLADALGMAIAQALGSDRWTRPALVPWPARVEVGPDVLPLHATAQVIATAPELLPHARVFAGELSVLLGRPVAAVEGGASAGMFVLQVRRGGEPESYRVSIEDRVLVTGVDTAAVARGTATVLQWLANDEPGGVRRGTIDDAPTCSYRGLLVDVARQPHPIAGLRQLVDLCRLYKIRYLQLHLTDDQAFTFPSQAFPKLATPGHSYTQAELHDLNAYATARGVTIVPELDVPGHCGAAIAAMPELFRASVKHHATLCFAKPEVLAAIDTLMGEMLAVFPDSPFFHIGGDEADLEHVHEEPEFQAAFEREQVADAQELYRRFLCQMNDRCKARGKRMLVWEGFGPGGKVAIPKDITVMAFESLYHLPDQLVASGYPVINTSWQPLYVVNDRCWSEAEIYRWNRGHWQHFVEGYPAFRGIDVPLQPSILGAQMCAWEQPAERELPSLRRRLAAMAERVWNESAGRTEADFMARLDETDELLGRLLAKR